MFNLRPYRNTDRDSVIELWWESWHSIFPGLRHPQTLAQWQQRWRDEVLPAQTVSVVTTETGNVIAFGAANVSARELTQLFVAPAFKRRGIGRRLLHWAREVMPTGFALHTLTDNHGSRALYLTEGLVEGDTRTSPVNGMTTIEYRWVPPDDAAGARG